MGPVLCRSLDRANRSQLNHVAGAGGVDQDGGQERAQFLERDAAHELAFVGIGDRAGLLRHHHDHRVGFLAQADGRAVPRAERFVQVLPLGEREDAGGEGDAVAFDDDAAVVNGVVREEDGFQHLRRGLAIHGDAGLDGFLELDGLLDGDERADAHVGQALDGLDDDLDVLALLVGGGEERQVAQLRQHPAQFRLEDHQHRQDEEGGEACPGSQCSTFSFSR